MQEINGNFRIDLRKWKIKQIKMLNILKITGEKGMTSPQSIEQPVLPFPSSSCNCGALEIYTNVTIEVLMKYPPITSYLDLLVAKAVRTS